MTDHNARGPAPVGRKTPRPVELRLPQLASWISSGPNEPVTAAEITGAIGQENLGRIAAALGKDPADAAEYLAQNLPKATDAATSGESATPTARSFSAAPDVLLIIFDAVPDQITLQEPAQGILFTL
ncbi:YidB family protein [Streptomyces sp. NPDC005989]|uniref:YidB family protein n=1 Tax=Streptomyces sp. NPDC005989 TaxID=3156727 RepID=UPI00341015EF